MPAGVLISPPNEPDRELEAQAGDLLRPSSELTNWAGRMRGVMDSPTELIERSVELREAKEGRRQIPDPFGSEFGQEIQYEEIPSKRLTAEEANKMYRSPGMQPFTEDINEKAAQIIQSRFQERQYFDNILSRASGWQYAGAVAQMFMVGAIDPVNLATSVVPVTRAVPFLRGLPLLAEEGTTVGARVLGRLGTGAVEGAAGAAIIEPVYAYYSRQEMQDYTMADSLMNVVFGAGLGAGINVSVPAIYRAGETVPDWMRGLKSKTVHDAQDTAISQLARGEVPQVDDIVKTDPRISAKQVEHTVELGESNSAVGVTSKAVDDAVNNLDFTKPIHVEDAAPSLVDEALQTNTAAARQVLEDAASHPKITLEVGPEGLEIKGKAVPKDAQNIELNGVKFVREDLMIWPHTPAGVVSGEPSWVSAKAKPPGVKITVANIIAEKDGRIWLVKKPDGSYQLPKSEGWQGDSSAADFARILGYAHTNLNTKVRGYVDDLNIAGEVTLAYHSERVGGMPTVTQKEDKLILAPLEDILMKKYDLGLDEHYVKQFKEQSKFKADANINNTEHMKVPPELMNDLKSSSIDNGESVGTLTQHDIMDFELYDAGKMGTNEGGLYRLKETGEIYYLKWYPNPDQAKAEYLSWILYKAMHEKVPEPGGPGHAFFPSMELVNDMGTPVVASKWVEGATPIPSPSALMEYPELVRVAQRDFYGDAWLANWDALQSKNIMAGPDGELVKIDYGGTLDWRAQGQKKGKSEWTGKVHELTTLKQLSTTPSAEVYAKASPFDLHVSLERVLAMEENDIRMAVKLAGYTGEEADHMIGTLLSRQEDIAAHSHDFQKVQDYYKGKGQFKLISAGHAIDYLKEKAKQIWNKYTGHERDLLKQYQGGDLGANVYLRDGKMATAPSWVVQQVKDMDAIMAKHPLEQETTLYRWVYKKNLTISGENINDQNFLKFIGRRGKDRGFMSTMMAKKGAFENAKDVEIIFKAPAGTKGVMLNAALSKEGKFHQGYDVEVEFITARDTSWTIQSVAKMDTGNKTWFQVVAQIDHPSQMNAPTVDQIHNHLANQSANKLSGGETPIPDLDMVAKEVDDLMTPTLTYEVESKSIAKIKNDITQIEADMKAAGIEPDAETKAMFEDADSYVKSTEDYAKAIKQAWICYKGL